MTNKINAMLDEFQDELDVLSSIYAESVIVELGCGGNDHKVTYRDPDGAFVATFHVPAQYPVQALPTVDIDFKNRVGEKQKSHHVSELRNLMTSMQGEVVLFAAVERLKELVADPTVETIPDIPEDSYDCDVPYTFQESTNSHTPISSSLTVIHGPLSMEQKSSFQSHFAVVHSMEEVEEFKQIVLSDKKIARATHNIFAYRFTCPNGTGVVYHDCDDDGETAAAGRVAEMIRLMGVDGIAIIVTRWFGGVLLGPDRFKYICNSARNLLEDHGYGKTKKR